MSRRPRALYLYFVACNSEGILNHSIHIYIDMSTPQPNPRRLKYFCHSVFSDIYPVSTNSYFTSLSSPILNTLNKTSLHHHFASHAMDIKRCRWPGSMSDNWWSKEMGCRHGLTTRSCGKVAPPIYHQHCFDWLTDLQTERLCYCAMCYVLLCYVTKICGANLQFQWQHFMRCKAIYDDNCSH